MRTTRITNVEPVGVEINPYTTLKHKIMYNPKLQNLKDELIDVCEHTPERVEDMTRYEMVDAWLKYNGIIGYTDDIITMLSYATGVNLRKKLGE